MKILLLISSKSYSIHKLFSNTLTTLGHEVKWVDPISYDYSRSKRIILYQIRKVNHKIADHYLVDKRLQYRNEMMLNEIVEFKPDIVLSYNESSLFPETVDKIKGISKFVIFLADNPFYSFYKKFFLQILLKADLVITPDTGCMEQLKATGISNIIYSNLGVDEKLFNKLEVNKEQYKKYKSDVFFIGSIHNIESWAYRRPLMLSNFTNYDLKIFGNRTWKKILPEFPNLIDHFTLLKQPMTFEELNLRMNCSKIYPIDAPPGILKGLHVRIFDAIAGNILPIAEYREDMDKIFKEVKLPSYKNFDELKNLAEYYIKNDQQRENLLKELRQYVLENYTAEACLTNLLEKIGN